MLLMCSLVFKLTKKRATRPNSLSHFKAREKKTRQGLNSLSCFQAHEKEVHPDPNSLSHFKAREKKTRQGLFFNLRLRKASKPLRERV